MTDVDECRIPIVEYDGLIEAVGDDVEVTIVSAMTVLDEPCTVTAQRVPNAVTVFAAPVDEQGAAVASRVWVMPVPTMWVSSLTAAA